MGRRRWAGRSRGGVVCTLPLLFKNTTFRGRSADARRGLKRGKRRRKQVEREMVGRERRVVGKVLLCTYLRTAKAQRGKAERTCTSRTTSCSSASASRSIADFLRTLVKTVQHHQLFAQHAGGRRRTHTASNPHTSASPTPSPTPPSSRETVEGRPNT